ncbi:unnamed protein product [Diamesa serratosioi]
MFLKLFAVVLCFSVVLCDVADPGIISFRDARNMNEILCLGSVLNTNWILSTSSCVGKFQGPMRFLLRAVDAKKRSYSIEKIVLHETYNNMDSVNDVALVRLSIPLTFTNSMKPIQLSAETKPTELRAYEWDTQKNIMFVPQTKLLLEFVLPTTQGEDIEEKITTTPGPKRVGRFLSTGNLIWIEEHNRNPHQLYVSSNTSKCFILNGSPLVNAQDNTIAGMASQNCKCITDPTAKIEFVNISYHYNWIQKNLN